MEIKRSDIIDYVRSLPVSPQLKGRFRVYILEKFPTATQFLVSTEQELRRFKCYGKNMVKLVTRIKEEFWKREHDENDRVLFDQRVQDTIEKLNGEYDKMKAKLNPVLTLPELQGIVSMMQLMNLDQTDLCTIRKFLDAIRVRPAESPAS